MGGTCISAHNTSRLHNKTLFRKIESIQIQNLDCVDIRISDFDLVQMKKQVSQCLEKGQIKIHDTQLLKLKKQISAGKIPLSDLIGLSKQISGSTQASDNKSLLNSFSISDFKELQQLGSGAFGIVSLVRYKGNNELYAIKVIKKSEILLYNMTQCAMLEKEILLENTINSSLFLLHLFASFQTPHKLYLVTEYMQGGDLFNLLQKKIQLKECFVKFYLAEILLAIEELHERNIIYRDLKPENILLSSSGHVKLADFGLTKHVLPRDRTYTICGTVEYQAPEMILKQGYTHSIDYWALGILTYELLHGRPPFHHPQRSTLAITDQILNNNIVFQKSTAVSNSCKAFIRECTRANTKRRLGNKGISQLKQHSFFNGINWERLKKQDYEPPFVVQSQSKGEGVPLREEGGKEYPRLVGFSCHRRAVEMGEYKLSF